MSDTSQAPATSSGHGLTFEFDVHFETGRRTAKVIRRGRKPEPKPEDAGSLPHVSRLMALALRMEALLETGQIRDYAEFARIGMISRSRVTQIMNLLLLAPDIQEELLFLPRTRTGRHPIKERDMREIATRLNWEEQKGMWERLKNRRMKAQH